MQGLKLAVKHALACRWLHFCSCGTAVSPGRTELLA